MTRHPPGGGAGGERRPDLQREGCGRRRVVPQVSQNRFGEQREHMVELRLVRKIEREKEVGIRHLSSDSIVKGG